MKTAALDCLVLATNNRHKVGEIRAILKQAGLRLRILTLADFPRFPPVVENRSTIEGNALKKATEVARRTKCVALADDTGLFIDALRERPGVYSARFAGPGCSFDDNNQKVLRLMVHMPTRRRRAEFRCVAALADPAGRTAHTVGKIAGRISVKSQGTRGFGYDSIFFVPRLKKTFAQISPALKNRISHRARAFSRVPQMIRGFLKETAQPKRRHAGRNPV